LAFILVIFIFPYRIVNNVIKVIISIEILFLSIQGMLIYFSLVSGDINGLVFYLLLFGVMTAETVIGICIINLKYANESYFLQDNEKTSRIKDRFVRKNLYNKNVNPEV